MLVTFCHHYILTRASVTNGGAIFITSMQDIFTIAINLNMIFVIIPLIFFIDISRKVQMSISWKSYRNDSAHYLGNICILGLLIQWRNNFII